MLLRFGRPTYFYLEDAKTLTGSSEKILQWLIRPARRNAVQYQALEVARKWCGV